MKKSILASLTACLLMPSAFGAVVYNDTITYINGTGNPNTGWVSDTANNILLGIRADDRLTGATPNNGAGTYTFLPGLVPSGHGPVADWNYQFTFNSDPAGNTLPLSSYNFWLTLSINGGPAGTPFNLLTLPDNSYGNNGTANGAGTVGTGALAATHTVAANSESITFLSLPNTGGIYQFDLYATPNNDLNGLGNDQLDAVSMTVDVVPEPTTVIAGLMLLLPLGVSAFRIMRKRQTA